MFIPIFSNYNKVPARQSLGLVFSHSLWLNNNTESYREDAIKINQMVKQDQIRDMIAEI